MKNYSRLASVSLFALCFLVLQSPHSIASEDTVVSTAGGPLSDLVISEYAARVQISTTWRRFTSSSCAYREGCVIAPGRRKLLRFYTRIINQGTQDFHLGNPRDPANAEHVQYDSCHGHYHVKDWANYELLSASGTTVIRGRKQAFCLEDSLRIYGAAPAQYTCAYQGITAGWADDYADSLPCQWIDITGVPPGSYILQLTVNPVRRFVERNYRNNRVRVPVTIR